MPLKPTENCSKSRDAIIDVHSRLLPPISNAICASMGENEFKKLGNKKDFEQY
jgi:hypothetical protein